MERAKLKLAVIFILAALNLFLLGSVITDYSQSKAYEETAQTQILVYLENRGIRADPGVIPWETGLSPQAGDIPDQVFSDTPLPDQGLGETWEVQTMRQPVTLLMDFARGLESLGRSCTQILSIREGYTYLSAGGRDLLTPAWDVDTDAGTFRLDCAAGTLTALS